MPMAESPQVLPHSGNPLCVPMGSGATSPTPTAGPVTCLVALTTMPPAAWCGGGPLLCFICLAPHYLVAPST